MAISVFPASVTSSLNADAITAVSANVLYEGRKTFDPAIYQITCASGTITNFQFLSNASTIITSGVTSSGTVSINLASTADRIRLWTNTGSNIVVTITKTASALTNNFSGTLDTISTVGTSTYTGTSTSGFGYVVVCGSGGGGGGGANDGNGAGGGGSGSAAIGIVQLTGSISVTIPAGGNGGTAQNNGSNGGTTTFGSITASGGSFGERNVTGGTNVSGGAGGTTNGGGGSGNSGQNGGAGGRATNLYPFITSSTLIGTAGTGGVALGGAGGAGTLSAGGGGGAGANGAGGGAGGAGGAGVVYVLRF